MLIKPNESVRTITFYVLIAVVLAVVCLPRFNGRETALLSGFTYKDNDGHKVPVSVGIGDAQYYIAVVQEMRNQDVDSRIIAPFVYRPLAPFLASFLPFDAMTSLNVINVLALFLTAAITAATVRRLKFGYVWQIIASMLFIVSFPTFYYGAIGYVDPVLIFLIALGVYLIILEHWWILTAVFFIGGFAKETICVLLPVAASYKYAGKSSTKALTLLLIVYCIALFGGLYFARTWITVDQGYIWKPSLSTLMMNITRLRAWGSSLLSFGLPGLLAMCILPSVVNKRREPEQSVNVCLCVGFLASLAVAAYAALSAHVDGRFMWITYPFSIPLALQLLQARIRKPIRDLESHR